MTGLTTAARRLLRRPLVVGLALLTAACQAATPAPAPTTDIVFGTVFRGQTWDLVGSALAVAYNRELPSVHVTTRPTEDLEQHVDGLANGQIHLAMEDAETAYLAYSSGTRRQPTPHTSLRAIGVLFSTAVQAVARRDAHIRSIADFAGRRVVTGADGGPTQRAARLILRSHGVAWDSVTHVTGLSNSPTALRSGEIDATFVYAPFRNPLIADVVADGSARLIPLDPRSLGEIQEGHHFLKSTIIPREVYPGATDDVLAVGMDVLLLCRADLPEDLVYHLARVLFASVPELARAHAAAEGISPDRGPATTIPLHPGAARFYREREILR